MITRHFFKQLFTTDIFVFKNSHKEYYFTFRTLHAKSFRKSLEETTDQAN